MKLRDLSAHERVKLFFLLYGWQSFLATVVLFVAILLLHGEHMVVSASLGATTFIIFAMPKHETARPANVLLGHLIGFSTGAFFSFIPHETMWTLAAVHACAAGAAIFIMLLFDLKHPPAAGTAIGVVRTGPWLDVILVLLGHLFILTGAHWAFRRKLADFTEEDLPEKFLEPNDEDGP